MDKQTEMAKAIYAVYSEKRGFVMRWDELMMDQQSAWLAVADYAWLLAQIDVKDQVLRMEEEYGNMRTVMWTIATEAVSALGLEAL